MSRVVRGINREMQAGARAGAVWAVQVARRIVAGPVRTASWCGAGVTGSDLRGHHPSRRQRRKLLVQDGTENVLCVLTAGMPAVR
jgi:hypothetical protein